MQEAIKPAAPSQAIKDRPPARADADAPEQTRQPNGNGKLFVLGTLNAEELQEYITDWIEGGLDWGADAAGALKHHCEMLVAKGPDAGFGATHLGCVQSCLIEVTLAGDSTDKLFGPLAAEVIFPHVDWHRACKDALGRGTARLETSQQERDARIEAEAQAAEDSADSAVSETPPSRGDAGLYAIRQKSDGEFHANDINEQPLIMQVHCFASFDEAAAARLLYSNPEDEIVPLIELSAADGHLAEENRQFKRALIQHNRALQIALCVGERLKQENAALQKENDEFAHELGKRDAAEPKSPIARRTKEVHPTTLYGLRCGDSKTWFFGNDSETLDGGPNVPYVPVFKSEEDARKYLDEAKMVEAVPGGDDNEKAYVIMPLAVVGASGDTSERSETSVADKGRELIGAK